MAPVAMTTAHVLLPSEILSRSPSLEDGVVPEDEQLHRFWGCELIEEAGVLLRLPQVVMVTAQTMLHRFYYRKSLRDFDAFRVAIGCLFLAAKVEEQPKRIREVLSVFYAMYRRRKWGKRKLSQQLLELESESYYLWRDWLIMVERQILIDLGFSLYNIMEHPHKYILYYIKILDGSKELAQKAWGYLNDSLRIDLCVRYRAEVIACAAIFVAARKLQVKLPDSPAWYTLFNVDRDSLVAVAQELVELYKREKIVWLDALTKVDPFAIDDLPDAEPESIPVVAVVKEPTDEKPTKPRDETPVAEVAIKANVTLEKPGTQSVEEDKSSTLKRDPERSSSRGRRSSPSRRRERDRSRNRGRDRDRDRDGDRSRRSRRSRSRSEERRSSRIRRDHERSRRSRSRSGSQDDRRSSRRRSRSRSSRRR